MEPKAKRTAQHPASEGHVAIADILGFIGICTFLVYLFLILFSTTLFEEELGSVKAPWIILMCLSALLTLPLLRTMRASFESRKGLGALKTVGFLCMCIAPICLLKGDGAPVWIAGAILMGIGVVCLSFLWTLYMCRFAHASLSTFLAFAMILAALISCGILLRSDVFPPVELILMVCIFGMVSWFCMLNINGLANLEYMSVSSEESSKRAITTQVDRWTYSLIGIDLGFAIGITHYLFSWDIVDASIIPAVPTFGISVILVAIVVIITQARLENVIETLSKDYLSFSFALALFLISVLPYEAKIIGVICLLIVTFLQIVILVNASIEFIRFEELSPLWYLAEEAFVAGGLVVGFLLTWISSLSSSFAFFLIPAGIAVLVNIFAQRFINEGVFPSSATISREFDEAADAQTQEEDQKPDELRGDAWVSTVDKICRDHGLTPRQSEILKLLANGRDSIYIENYFHISKSTAKSHIYSIYKKLNIHSRQELIDIVEKEG